MPLEIIIIIIGTVFSALMIAVSYFVNRQIQPKQLWLLFFAEMWERFSFYGMRALLILFLTKVFLYDDVKANLQYGVYNALVYTFPLLGGWIADRYLGFRKSIVLGGVLMTIGHLVLAIPINSTFFLGLGFLISGNSFFKPNISSLLGKFYAQNDIRKDSGYSIFYMGINIGAFLGSALCGYLGQEISWHLGFGMAGVFMLLGLLIFVLFQHTLGSEGLAPDSSFLEKKQAGLTVEWLFYLGAAVAVLLFMWLLQHYETKLYLSILFGVASVAYILYISFQFDNIARKKLWAAMALIVLSVLFWGFYEQGGGSLNLMALRNVAMRVGNHPLPSAMVNNSINPFYIVLLSPIMATMWQLLSKHRLEPSIPMKFALAFFLVGIGYAVFYIGGINGAATGYMPLVYFLAAYLFITLGELFLSPIGLSMVTKLSPTKMFGLVMGMWFLATAFGHDLAGYIGTKMAIPKAHPDGTPFAAIESLPIYMNGCKTIFISSFIIGILLILLSPLIKKWMHDAA